MTEANKNQLPPFEIKKVYLKDLSFESPLSPVAFISQYKPALTVDFKLESNKIEQDPGSYDSVIRVTATCKDADDENKIYFVCEVKFAGVFAVRLEDLDLRHALDAVCPTILFPYASEKICSLVAAGGFPPVVLPPVNFEALFAQKLEREQVASANDDKAAQ